MPKFLILHAIKPDFDSKPQMPIAQKYEAIAIVETVDIVDVFRVSNHIDSNWTQNPEVKELWSDPNRTRSTSVGDIVVTADGKAHLCASFSWEEIPDADLEFVDPEIRLLQPYRCPSCGEKLEVTQENNFDINPVTGKLEGPVMKMTTFRCSSCSWNSEDQKDPIVQEILEINKE